MNFKFFRFLPLFFLFITGCATDDIGPLVPSGDPEANFFTPHPETLILDEDTNTDLVAFDVESGEMTYREGSPQLDSIEIGSVIVSGPSDEAPAGFLRRVTGLSVNGDATTYATEAANLPDAFSAYRWNMTGRSGVQPRNEEPGVFSFVEPVDKTYEFDVPGEDYKFQLRFRFAYALDFISQIEYTPSLTGGEVTSARLGVERLSIDTLLLEMAFVLDGEETTEQSFSSGEIQTFFENIFTIPLSPIPIGPGASPVYVTPSVQVDLSSMLEYSVILKQTLRIKNTGDPYREVLVLQPGGGYVRESGGTAPTMGLDVDLTLDGSFSYATGLSLGVAVSPYSRSLFALGTRITAAPKVTLGGTAAAALIDVTPAFNIGAQAKVDLALSAGVFLDADFFGFAPDSWDLERTLWDETIPLLEATVDNSCGDYFNSVVINSIICSGPLTELRFNVASFTAGGADVSGNYAVYLDGRLIGSGYPTGEEQLIILPEDIGPGAHRLRFLRETGGSDFFLCESDEMIFLPDCAGTDFCQGERQIMDPRTAYAYCAGEFAGKDWFLSNLYTLLSDGSAPRCYDSNGELCTSYGGYYSFDDLLEVGPDASPASRRGLCPEGFHVPSKVEWLGLFGLAPTTEPNDDGKFIIPGVLNPYRDETSWANLTPPEQPNGFRAIAAGGHTVSSNPVFSGLGDYAYFWTSDVAGADAGAGGQAGAYAVFFDGLDNTVEILPAVRTEEYSCRCVED